MSCQNPTLVYEDEQLVQYRCDCGIVVNVPDGQSLGKIRDRHDLLVLAHGYNRGIGRTNLDQLVEQLNGHA